MIENVCSPSIFSDVLCVVVFRKRRAKGNANETRIIEASFAILRSVVLFFFFFLSANESFFTIDPSRGLRNCRLPLRLLSEMRVRGAGHEAKDTEIQATSPNRRIGKIFCRGRTVSAWIENPPRVYPLLDLYSVPKNLLSKLLRKIFLIYLERERFYCFAMLEGPNCDERIFQMNLSHYFVIWVILFLFLSIRCIFYFILKRNLFFFQ